MALWIPLLLAAVVPQAVAGPDLAETAKAVEAPIEKVTVFSDRARVERVGRAEVGAGVAALRLPDLPGGVLVDTIRVGSPDGKVLRVETAIIQRERVSIEQVEALIVRLEEVSDGIARIDAEVSAIGQSLSLLQSLTPKPPVDEGERVGKLPPLNPVGWKAVLDFSQARRAALRKRLRELSEERRELAESLQKTQAEIAQHNLGGMTDRKIQVLVLLAPERAGSARLELEYYVPGARWTPAYELHFDPNKKQLAMITSGQVQQASGEDWSKVKLALSTAIPGYGIDMPELLTWTLGEKKEWLPVPRPERPMAAPPRHALPRPQPIAAEADRAARMEELQVRLQRLQVLLASNALASDNTGLLQSAPSSAAERARPRPPPRPSSRRMPQAAPSRSDAPAAPPSSDEYGFAEESIEGDLSMPDGAYMEHRVTTKASRSSKKPAAQKAAFPLDEPGPVIVRPTFSDPRLPAVSAGGLDYVWDAPLPANVPSTGQDVRVPLGSVNWPVETFYEATPSLMKTAFLSAEATNKGRQPILRGPMSIFSGGDFVAEGELETTGPGGTIRLPLGADEDLRFEYTVVPATVTEGLIKKDEITTYSVTIEVGNYKKRPVRLVLFDQIPKTNNQDIEVKLLGATPPAASEPDGNGRLEWQVDLPAGKTQKITFQYRVRRPADFRLYQR